METMANRSCRFGITAAAVLMLAACAPAATTTTARIPTKAPTETAEPYRATAEGPFPAAGICASFKEATIRVEIRDWPGNVPDPRCIRVREDQNLVIQNTAAGAITFTLGRYHATIEPGGTYTIAQPFGEYLLPGAHSLHIMPYGGPEIYFDSTKDTK